ncbi:MAG: polysaccharide deacetylase family protein [Clostridia bacterium]|nr:polysaccharide deacetylase family protein [Clostridia bacterium]
MTKAKNKKLKIISIILVVLLGVISILGLFNYFIYHNNSKMVVLTWHRVVASEIKEKYYKDNEWVNDLTLFEKQIKYLYDNGYKTLSMDEYYDWLTGKVKYNTSKTCVLTFDDGDIENYYNVLPVLKKYNFKATVFIVGSLIKPTVDWPKNSVTPYYLSEELINKMREEYPNFEIQSHTYNFHRKGEDGVPIVSKMSRAELEADFDAMEKFGTKYLAYPHGYNTKLIQEVAEEKGYNLAFGFTKYGPSSKNDNFYNIRRVKVSGNKGMLNFKWNLRLRLTNKKPTTTY